MAWTTVEAKKVSEWLLTSVHVLESYKTLCKQTDQPRDAIIDMGLETRIRSLWLHLSK